ncbi:MAG: glycosyltransferase [Deltaproteobacteria bacterium HGW-Deltaproteobacteria-13]|jgi:glycosyltransferase involved in cell wall biosynthesis|nr:MAG: glycosyltransferase [Deltaproteobacteria bacterium HGW-Deltaproteobacteria-13]
MNNQSAPLISIIVAVSNGAKTLQKCMDSVFMQTYKNKELIIIDGGSADGTVDIVIKNSDKINYWISEPDQGICSAWNKGLLQAKGDWICFLGADDYFWDLQVLERMTKSLIELPTGIRVAYGQVMIVNEREEGLYLKGEEWNKAKKYFTQYMSITHQGVMHRRSLFELRGRFDESFRIAGDYELLLRELKTGEAMFIPDIIVTAMRQGGLSSAPANTIEAMLEFRRAQKMHGQYFPGVYWVMAMIRVYIRLVLWHLFGEKTARKLLDLGRRVYGLPPYWTRT